MRNRFRIPILALTLLFTVGLIAQESTVKGNIGGTVFDPSGAVVSGAKLTLNGPTGNRTITSDAEGHFGFDLLTPGVYAVKAEMTGFKTVDIRSISVDAGKTSNIRVSLLPGGATETVEVTASAVTVDTAATGIQTNLNDTFYQNLPVARNVTSLFYASAGVTDGGGTGSANPSIAGGSGLENQYVADGVNITDGAFGGIGVYSRVYGPLATGINLSFVKEVDVKTGGYEPQYGKTTGGVVQIVTKSGGNEFHGEIAGFFGPQAFEAARLNPDNFGRVNMNGITVHQGAWDVAAELGGYIPRFKDHLFFFGAFNPSYNAYYDRFADMHGVTGLPVLPQSTLGQYTYDYSGKITWKLNDKHTVEASVFGDPTRESNFGPNSTLATLSRTTFDKLSSGTRNVVARYNATLSPTWLFNASISWGRNYLTDTPSNPDVYQVVDYTGRTGATGDPLGPLGTPLTGQYTRQGLGFYENTVGNNYSTTFDTQKVVSRFLGEHTLSVGYHYERNYYSGSSLRTGPGFTITPQMSLDSVGDTSLAGKIDNASFQLRRVAGTGVWANVPGYGLAEVALLQVRGTYSDPHFHTGGRYHAAYANDSWALNRHITVNAGYRWEQQFMLGSPYNLNGQNFHVHYTFTDNWSPRFGLSIDPMGDRKTKIYGNFARTSYAIPLDLAIRSLSNEQDAYNTFWLPPSTGPSDGSFANLAVNSDGTLAPLVLNDSTILGPLFVSAQSGEAIAPGTKMQYLQEFVGGVQHEFQHGIVVDLRFQDRRLRRIVEDMGGVSPEGANFGEPQYFVIGNPSPTTDLFVNEQATTFPVGAPVVCPTGVAISGVTDFNGNLLPGECIANGTTNLNAPGTAGFPTPDGKADGFAKPVRIYRAMELETTKSFSKGWQWRMNYRWAELLGNYEGAFRNDNGQSDPSISSLFDFTQGKLGLLGDQFAVGNLNTDRRHTFNNYLSYSFSSTFLKNLTLGSGVRIQTGNPINELLAHPVYANAGEIPIGGRGALGRTNTSGQADIHADYALKLTEKQSLHFMADMFNITDQRTQLRIDQNKERTIGILNADYLKPVGNGNIGIPLGFQRPFYGRLAVRWVF
ncbi:MAG TPA: carboxypeptidase regulatory-like domain-containing protein [Terriglobales bacterium]